VSIVYPVQASEAYSTITNEIMAQSGGITKVGSIYYWVGTKFNGSNWQFAGVELYSSSDLVNWKFEREILSPGNNGAPSSSAWCARPFIVYNSSTNKYVLIAEHDGDGYNSKIGMATCSTIN